MRYPSFEDEYDFTTLFNDAFWNVDGTAIILIGPPLLNLPNDLGLKFVALPSGAVCPASHMQRVWMGQTTLEVPAGTNALAIEAGSVRFVVAPQPNLSALFAGRRVVFTMNRNNDLQWIRDWARFYALEHGCEAVLFYDNNSDRYGLADVDDAIRSACEGLEVAVVDWAFPYGVFDGRRELAYLIWDGFFSQRAIFEHARRRFLARARSVINADIDELAISQPARSICEMVETSSTGLLRYDGWWIENVAPTGSARPRHRDYYLRKRGRLDPVEPKWAVVPSRCPDSAQWSTHIVHGMAADEASLDVSLRHFRAINTNWDVHGLLDPTKRTEGITGSAADLEVDEPLRQRLERVFAADEPDEDAATDDRPDAMRAYTLRLLAAEARAAGDGQEAVRLASEARRLLPAHQGFAVYLADLLQAQGESEKAEGLRQEASRLQGEDAAYHLQLGRVALRCGDIAEGKELLQRALAMEPRLKEACGELLAAGQGRDDPEEASAMLLACLKSQAPDDHLSLAEVADLLLQQGMRDEALAAIDRAIALQEHWSYYQIKARALADAGDNSSAIAALQRAIACSIDCLPVPSYPVQGRPDILPVTTGWLKPNSLYIFLAQLLCREGRIAEAEEAARQGVRRAPLSIHAWQVLAGVLARDGRRGEADEALAKRRALVKRSLRRMKVLRTPDADLVRAVNLLLSTGDHEGAAEALSIAEAAGVTDWRIEQAAAKLALERKATSEAISHLGRAIALNPEHIPLHSSLAGALMAEHRWDEAIEVWQAITIADDDNAAAYRHLSEALRQVDRLDEAVAAMRRAIAIRSDVPNWHCTLGALLASQSKWELAAEACRRAVELDPGFARAQSLLRESQRHL